MKKTEKYLTMALALIGAIAGLGGAYTAYDASKFKQPFDEHDQISKSYMAQISSAERRNDRKEVIRVRLLYEMYEEKWRAATRIAQIVSPLESLASVQLSTDQRLNLKELLRKVSEGPNQPTVSSKTLGAAYLAIHDFDSAATQLTLATSRRVDSNTLALKAAAFSGLAVGTSNPDAKSAYERTAAESYVAALKAAPRSGDVSGFAAGNPDLKRLLYDKGIALSND